MTDQEVQNYVVATYNENIQYLKTNHKELFDNLTLLETALELKQIKAKFDLHFENNSFDIVNLEQKQLFYGNNSYEVSKKMVENQVDLKPQNASFKAFYDQQFNDEFAKNALKAPINERNSTGNAPIIHYVTKSLPQNELLNEIYKFIVFGVGLGIHIPLIHQKVKAKAYLIVEPNIEIFKLSLFVTNYAQLAKEAKIQFSVAHDEAKFRKEFDILYCDSFVDNHYFKFFKLTDNCEIYMKTVQNYLVSQGHYLYSYDRTFLSIFRTNKYITNDYKILDISKIQTLDFMQKPILVLAAGPSLQRNIEFIKENQDKFTIVAIYATLPLLERNGIKPDIITQYDEQNHQVLNTLEKIKDINFFNNSILLIASHVNEKLTNSFPKENIYIFQAMFELKKDFGTLTSPSIGELTYALTLKLGAKEVYLLGLDLALDSETNESHIEGHSGSKALDNLKDLEESSDQNYSYRKNTITVRGNLQAEVKTVPVFKSNIDSFNFISQEFNQDKHCNTYNLSNGAYLNNTIPTRIENLDLKTFESFKNGSTLKTSKEQLNKLSEESYNKQDLELINLKISAAKKFKKSLEKFYKVKSYKSYDEYKSRIFLLLNELLFEASAAKDLQSIITNYCQHNLHFVFHLFNTQEVKNYKKHIKNINEILYIQFTKIINTYVTCISYSTTNDRTITKKLNKFLKENSIKNTIYSELFFKEIVESSKPGEQQEFNKNSIGFFAIEENLGNKNFVDYIKTICNKLPHISVKIFYFYEYQKFQAEYMFKSEKERLQLILPKNIDNIAKEVELWIENCDLTYNIRRTTDILLNNYKNIYSVFFKDEIYQQELEEYKEIETNLDETLSLKEQLEQNYILPNTLYNKFCDTLKEEIDEKKLNKTYKKEHIGFFGFEENVTTDFVKNIYEIANTFNQLKFVVFYFEEKQKQQYQEVFANILDRFEFIIPRDIYEITSNIELWVQAEIKNQSYLFSKVTQFLDLEYIYSLTINEKISTEQFDKTNYLPVLINNYDQVRFSKSINYSKYITINNTQNINIGILFNNDIINDLDFLNYLNIIIKRYQFVTFKIVYNDIELLESLKNAFNKETNVKIEKINLIDELINNINIFITNYDNQNNKVAKKIRELNTNIFIINYTLSLKKSKINIYSNYYELFIKKYPYLKTVDKEKRYYHILFYEVLKQNSTSDILQVNENDNLYNFIYFEELDFIIKNPAIVPKYNEIYANLFKETN